MPVYSDSRYALSRLLTVTDDRNDAGVERGLLYDYVPVPSDSDVNLIHTVQADERLDQLAFRYAGDSRMWWVIADVNDIFGFPLFIAPGTQLRIPSEEVFRRARELSD